MFELETKSEEELYLYMRGELDSSFQKTQQVNGFNTIRERDSRNEL